MSKKIVLKSSDGESFEVDEVVALESQTIQHLIEEGNASNEIPLPTVTSNTLSMVIEYCKKHVEATTAGDNQDDNLEAWDTEFVKVDQSTIFDIMLAAHYLNIKGLRDLTCKTVADMMRGKKPAEIRTLFNIKNDYTPKEEEEVIKENPWAFE